MLILAIIVKSLIEMSFLLSVGKVDQRKNCFGELYIVSVYVYV